MKPWPLPRVLLVEDDVSLQRFVQLALDEQAIELLCVSSVEEALRTLAAGSVTLLITDLMLPGRSGLELVEELAARPALRGSARIAVFSAGLQPAVRERLAPLPVWRLLDKPCSVAALEDCVRDALQVGGVPVEADSPASGAQATAIAEFFGGNAELYQQFRGSCLRQFAQDGLAGEQACQAQDAAALQRLAHSLKSVLLTLGHQALSEQAYRLELDCADSDAGSAWPARRRAWQQLNQGISALR